VPFVTTRTYVTGASLLIPAGIWGISTGFSFLPTSSVGDGNFNNIVYGLSTNETDTNLTIQNRRYGIFFNNLLTYESYADNTVLVFTKPTTVYLVAYVNNTAGSSGNRITNCFINATLMKGLSSVLKLTTPLPKLLIAKPAWAVYRAEDFNAVTQQLRDSSVNARHATCTNCTLLATSGFGASTSIPSVVGSTTSTILFPVGSIPPIFTMFAITRYTGTINGRILTGTGEGGWGGNYFLGHWQNNYPRAFYFSTFMSSDSAPTTSPKVNFCNLGFTTASTVPNNVIYNSAPIGTVNKSIVGEGTVSARLSVNLFNPSGTISETSDFALSQLIIWDRELTTLEMLDVSNAFTFYLNNGYY
jgi:hypothetical protein